MFLVTMNNNQIFKAEYNQLDDLIKRLSGNSKGSGIVALEKVSPAEIAGKLDTIRNFKNTIISHNKIPGPEPQAPTNYIDFLDEELTYVKSHQQALAKALRQAESKTERSHDKNDGVVMPPWINRNSGEEDFSYNDLDGFAKDIYEYGLRYGGARNFDDLVNICTMFVKKEYLYISDALQEMGIDADYNFFNKNRRMHEMAAEIVSKLSPGERKTLIRLLT